MSSFRVDVARAILEAVEAHLKLFNAVPSLSGLLAQAEENEKLRLVVRSNFRQGFFTWDQLAEAVMHGLDRYGREMQTLVQGGLSPGDVPSPEALAYFISGAVLGRARVLRLHGDILQQFLSRGDNLPKRVVDQLLA